MEIWCYRTVVEYDQYPEVFREIRTYASVHAHLGLWCYRSIVEYNQYPEVFKEIRTYASVHAHLGRSAQRRHDLKSLAYTNSACYYGREIRVTINLFSHPRKRWLLLLICCCFCPPPFKQFLEIVDNMRQGTQLFHIYLFEYLIGENPSIRTIKTNGPPKVGVAIVPKI